MLAHGLQSTWPQGTVSTALMVFVRFLSHAGHIRFGGSEEDLELGTFLKLIVTRDLREIGCLFSGDDAGHKANNFAGLASFKLFVEGVRDGTQKEGKVGFAD